MSNVSKYHPNKGQPIKSHPWKDRHRLALVKKILSTKSPNKEVFLCPSCHNPLCIAGECVSDF